MPAPSHKDPTMPQISMTRRRALLWTATGLALAPALAARVADAAPSVQVLIKDFAFVPAVVTVAPGTTVTWLNVDDDPHAVRAEDKSFGSPALDTREHFAFTFTRPGDFGYFCTLHPHMTGHVIVKPA